MAGGLEGRLSQRLAASDVNVGVLQTGSPVNLGDEDPPVSTLTGVTHQC